MTESIEATCRVTHSQDNPCSGSYSLLVPNDRDEAGFRIVRVSGVALEGGTYRVRFERVGDA